MRIVILAALASLLALPVPAASHLVTGNGYGFAVVQPDDARITRFYAHPYSFTAPVPGKPYAEGIETTNFLDSIAFNPRAIPGRNSAEYLDDSHIIRIHSSSASAFVFMPFSFNRNALIVGLFVQPASAPSARPRFAVKWAHPLESSQAIAVADTQARILRFSGISESLLLIPLGRRSSVDPRGVQAAIGSSFALLPLEPGDDPIAAVKDFAVWRFNRTVSQLLQRELRQFEAWRAKPGVHFRNNAERHLWRQSETMLRIAQSREPNTPARHNNGMIVACLPDGVYFTHWVRDMAWATVALIRMGHQAEARAAILAYFNAQPTGKMRALTNDADYQVSVVRYFGNGEEEPFFTGEGQPNVEFDDWGEVLWALGEYLAQFNDPALLATQTYRGSVYGSARDFIVKPLLANLEPYPGPGPGGLIVAADTSIWEEHQADKKHFAFSTFMAMQGLESFRVVATRDARDLAVANELGLTIRQLRQGFSQAFIRDGHLHGTLEPNPKNDIDGALLPMLNFGLAPLDNQMLARDTAARMEQLRVASGGYERVKSNYTDPAIFEYWYERQEFVFTDLSLAELDRRIHRNNDAGAILSRVTRKAAADHNIIPEMYVALPCKLFPGAVGAPTGATPMVGYGAGAYILNLLAREQSPSTPADTMKN